MAVEVRLFATFRNGRFKINKLDLPVGCVVRDVLENVEIPVTEVGVLMVNGKNVGFDQKLSDNDVVAIFPAIGGG